MLSPEPNKSVRQGPLQEFPHPCCDFVRAGSPSGRDILLLQLQFSRHSGNWSLGHRIARQLLSDDDPASSPTIAEFYFSLAQFQLLNGDERGAQRTATLALSLDNSIEIKIRKVEELSPILLYPSTGCLSKKTVEWRNDIAEWLPTLKAR